jgi:tetratricopeptide (TPR) repeat protein
MAVRHRIALAAVLLAAVAAYLPGLDGEFVYDDTAILASPLVHAPSERPLSAWLVAARPLTEVTFALNRLAVGTDPRGWHLTSIAIHACVALLAWLLARRTLARAGLADPDLPAIAAAALFALHPLQTEAVAYLSQRAEVLASGLYLAALLLLLARDAPGAPRRRHALLAGACVLQSLGALAKPIVATLPAAWLLHAAILPAPGEEALGALQRVRRRLAASAPLFALTLASAIRELRALAGSGHAGLDIPGLPPLRYLATQLSVIPTYLRLALWPSGQSAYWDFPLSPGLGDPRALAGAVFLIGLWAAAILAVRRAGRATGDGAAAARASGFGVLFFLLALAPTSSVVPLLDPLAEHRVYLPLLGLATAAAACGAWGARRLPVARARLVAAALGAVLTLALAGATVRRAAVWRSHVALWSDAAEKGPGSARAQLNLGTALYLEQRYEEALAAYRRAQALQTDGSVEPELIMRNVVGSLSMLGRLDEARQVAEAELRRAPRSADAWGLLAQVEFMAERDAESERAARRALTLDASNGLALRYLGELLSRRGEHREARELLRAAAAARPNDTVLQLELGRVEERLGDRDAACRAFDRAATEPGLDWAAAEAREAYRALRCR